MTKRELESMGIYMTDAQYKEFCNQLAEAEAKLDEEDMDE